MAIWSALWRATLLCSALAAQAAAPDAAPTDAEVAPALRRAASQIADGREAWLMLKLVAHDPSMLDRHDRARLEGLAAAAREHDPLLLRDALIRDHRLRGYPQPAAALTARLQVIDPDNAHNVLWELLLAPDDVADAGYDERIARMAGLPRHDDDFLAVLSTAYRTLARGYGLDPEPAAEVGDERTDRVMAAAMGIAAAIALPGYQRLLAACDGHRFPARGDDCRTIAHRLNDDRRSLVEHGIAAVLLRQSARNADERDQAAEAMRQAQWLMQASVQLQIAMDAAPDASAQRMRRFTALLTHGETATMRAALRENGMPDKAP